MGIQITVAYFEVLSQQLLRETKANHDNILQLSRYSALFSVNETEIIPSHTRRLVTKIQVGKIFKDFRVLNYTRHGVKHPQVEDLENDLQLWR
jgi:hypothetical protein